MTIRVIRAIGVISGIRALEATASHYEDTLFMALIFFYLRYLL